MQPQAQKPGPEAAPISNSVLIAAPLGSAARTPSTTPGRTNTNQPTLSLAETGVGFASLVLPTANTKERFITAVSTDLNTPDIKLEDFFGGKGFQQIDSSKPGVMSHPKGEVAARPPLSDQTSYLDWSPVSQELVDGETLFDNERSATPTPEVDDNMEIEEDINLLLNVNFPEIFGVENILKDFESKTISPMCVMEKDMSIHNNALIHDADPMLSAANNCMAPPPIHNQLPSRERQQHTSLTEINSRPLTNYTGVVGSRKTLLIESADIRLQTNLTEVADSRAPLSTLDVSEIAGVVLPGNSNKPTNSEEFGKDEADVLQQILRETDIQFDSYILEPTAAVQMSNNETLVPLEDSTFLVHPSSSGPHLLQPSTFSTVPLQVQPSTSSAGLLPTLAQQQQILFPNLSSDLVSQEEGVSTNCHFGPTVEVVDASDQIKIQSLLNHSTVMRPQILHSNTTLSTVGGQSIQSLISPSTVVCQPNCNATPAIQVQMNNHAIPNAQNILYATTPSVPMTEQQVFNTNTSLNPGNQAIQLVLNSPAPKKITLKNAPLIVQASAKRLGKRKPEVKNDRPQNMMQGVHPYDSPTTILEVRRGVGPVRTRERRAARKPPKLTKDYILNETSDEVTDVKIVSSFNPTATHTRVPSTSPFIDPQVPSTNSNSVNDPDLFSDTEEPSTSSGRRQRKVNIKDLTDEQKYRWTRLLNNKASKRCREKRKTKMTKLEAEEEILKEKKAKLSQKLTQITQRRDRIRALFELYKNALLRNQAPH